MSLLSVLKTIGKDLSHVGTWIEDGLKIVTPEISAINAPVGAILTAVEGAIAELETTSTHALDATTVQAVITAVSTLEGIKPGLTALIGAKIPATAPATPPAS